MRLLPAQLERPPVGALLVLLSPFNPSSKAQLRGSLLLLHGVSSVTSNSAQDSIFYSPVQAGKLFLGPALTGFSGGSDGKVSACNAGDPGSIPGLGRSPGEGNGNPLQYSCLENPMDRGAWWATVQSRTRLSDFSFFHSDRILYLLRPVQCLAHLKSSIRISCLNG